MSRVPPIDQADLPDLGKDAQGVIDRMGFLPTSQRVMARQPGLVDAFLNLSTVVMAGEQSRVSLELKNLVAHMASATAGCMYCSAHTGSNASRSGADDDKVANIWSFETSDRFSDGERAALRYAQLAAQVPNMVTDDTFDDLREHFDDGQIVELTSVICLFGFLNRWNDSMATVLEGEPVAFAERALSGVGWTKGKHTDPTT